MTDVTDGPPGGVFSVPDRLERLKSLDKRRVVGLNIGTSLDAIDAVLLEVSGFGLDLRFSVQEFLMDPLPAGLRERLSVLPGIPAPEISRLHVELGEILGAAAIRVAGAAGVERGEVDLVGSHGLTAFHDPPRRTGERGSTLQIGDIDVIREVVGSVVVGDFRTGDVAAMGHGAPLMPWFDHLVFREQPGTLALNLGGIANVTFVASDIEDISAFDTGPANMPLDEVTRRLTGGRQQFDMGGNLAATGRVDPILLKQLMGHPHVVAMPPKTTGREAFGSAWVDELLERHKHMKLVDILATLTAFVAHAVVYGCSEWVSREPIRRVVVSGGGAHNLTLMDHLRRLFDPVPVEDSLNHVCHPDAKEAILFALLANDRLFGAPTNIPSATGAAWPVSLGKVVW